MIGIVCAGQIELSPFVKKYTDVFDRKNIEYEIIHWDRSGCERPETDKMYTFVESVDRYAKNTSKFMPFMRFSCFAKKIIKRRKYEKLVILTTQTAVMLADLLLTSYRGKYFFDYRDASYEYIKPYSILINKLANSAFGMCISSPGFRECIKTKTPMVIAHNFQNKNYENRCLKCEKKNSGSLVMGYIGILREYEYLKKLMANFGNDDRFEFVIYGSGDDVERLREHSKKYENVRVMGEYKEEDKRDILTSFDIICYNYPYSFMNYPAVANKFYDGLIMKKPMFANSATFSGKLIIENGLGISLDEGCLDTADRIYEYYKNFDADEFSESCERFLDTVLEDEKKYVSAIDRITE